MGVRVRWTSVGVAAAGALPQEGMPTRPTAQRIAELLVRWDALTTPAEKYAFVEAITSLEACLLTDEINSRYPPKERRPRARGSKGESSKTTAL